MNQEDSKKEIIKKFANYVIDENYIENFIIQIKLFCQRGSVIFLKLQKLKAMTSCNYFNILKTGTDINLDLNIILNFPFLLTILNIIYKSILYMIKK